MKHTWPGLVTVLCVTLGSSSLSSASKVQVQIPSMEKRAALDDCLSAAGVPVDAPGSADWKADATPFNRRLPAYTPVAIVVARTVAHVQAAVACAARVGVRVSPKSGGHSYASFGFGGEDGHLMVELDRMFSVSVDAQTHMATIQAGARLGHVTSELNRQAGRGFSMGTCPGVGLAGHVLHGGFGFSSHTYGLALDWMRGATVVLANATVVNCSATENPDLFWALRGAGSSFGIVTSFVFDTFAVPSQVTVFSINLPWQNAQAITQGWTTLQNWMLGGGMASGLNMRIFANGGGGAQLQGMFYGNEAGLRSATSSLTSQLKYPLSNVQTTDWMGGFTNYAYSDTIDATVPYNYQETFFAKSLVTTNLSATAMAAAADYWINKTRGLQRDWYLIVDLYGGPNAYIPQAPMRDSASYAHRGDALFLYQFYDRVDSGNYPSDGLGFLNGWVDSITQNLAPGTWGMYANYADPTMNRTVAQRNYYRQSLPRLQRIKGLVDPGDLFHYPQAVEPAPAVPAAVA